MAMSVVSFAELRAHLKRHFDAVCKSGAPLVVSRPRGGSVVVLPLDEYEQMEETLHLLKSTPNRERLRRSIADAEAGRLEPHDLVE
ncbi:MAG: type II toxin-antitoxin system Phd/YefM family antitoxin [Stellaceae bacterium]